LRRQPRRQGNSPDPTSVVLRTARSRASIRRETIFSPMVLNRGLATLTRCDAAYVPHCFLRDLISLCGQLHDGGVE
jgi:hypothetical protein